MKFKHLICQLIAILLAGTGVWAASPAPVTLTVENATCDMSTGKVSVDISVDAPEAIMGAAFTVQYDTRHLDLQTVDSTFFDSFKNQFEAAKAINRDLTEVTVGKATHTRPLVVGDEVAALGGTRIAAVRVRPETRDNTPLFTLGFTVRNARADQSFPIKIVPSVVTNEAAGYPGKGEALPMLIGQTQEKEFPALEIGKVVEGHITFVDTSKTRISGTLAMGGKPVANTEVTLYSPLTRTTYSAVTDDKGHFQVIVSNSAASADLKLSINSPAYGKFDGTVSAAGGKIEAGFTNTAPEKPVLIAKADKPTGLTPTFETEGFYDANNGHGQTQWQIVDRRRLEKHNLHLADIMKRDGTIGEAALKYLAYQSTNSHSLTQLTVPRYTLDADAGYYIRSRFFDNCAAGPMASPWSDFAAFRTAAAPEGTTRVNGVLMPEGLALSKAEMEIFHGDVVGIRGAGDAMDMGITQPENAKIGFVSSQSIADLGEESRKAIPENVELPYGVVGFNLNLDAPDATDDVVDVTIQFDTPIPDDMTWWKYNESETTWIDYSEHATFASNRLSVRLDLKDGGFGDFDGIKNGRIVDPGGVGTKVEKKAESHGGGSCYITTLAGSNDAARRAAALRFLGLSGALLLGGGLMARRRTRVARKN